MALNFSKALNIQREERGVVFLLLAQSVFLGIFAGALDVGANSLFLEAYSADLMPRAFMISGVVGIVFTSLYTWLQKRINFKLFTIFNLVFVVLIAGALRFGYSITDDIRLSFVLLVMMGPIVIISMLGFWGTAGRYFTLREGKRLFGIIDTGSVFGMILAFYAVPVLVRFDFKVYNTLFIGGVSLVIALVLQVLVLQRHKLPAKAIQKRSKVDRGEGFFGLFRNKYTRLMAFFVVLSVIAGFFIHYSFMWATEANYPDSRELSSFLGAFFGTMMIATVVIKSTLYAWLMKNFGLRITLVISPILLLILTVVASVVGGFFGYSAEAASFTLFFLVIALSKLFNKSLKDAIESPSMKILYQSLDAEVRYDVQARIDGVVNEITAFSTGVLMAGLLMVSFIDVIHFSYLLTAILVIWAILGFALYRAYRKTLNDSLASVRSSNAEEEDKDEEPVTVSMPMYSDAMQLNPYYTYSVSRENLIELLSSKDSRLARYAWESVSASIYSVGQDIIDRTLKDAKNREVRAVIEQYIEQHTFSGKDLKRAFRSNKKEDKLGALVQTVLANDHKQVPNIITLLRDNDLQVRAASIEAAGFMKVKELGAYLTDYLGHKDLYEIAWISLVRMGNLVIDNLENAFHKSGVSSLVQLRIVRAMVAIGGEQSQNYLYHKITYHQRLVREAAIDGLHSYGYSASEEELPTIQTVIYELVSAGAKNIAAEYVVEENDPQNGLRDAIIQERKKIDSLIFCLLAIAYDRNAVMHVQRSFEDEENQDTGFALELLNLIVDDQVIAYLEPYLDDLPVPDKIRKLQNEIPVEILAYEDVLLDLINGDALYSGSYLKICAIDAIGLLSELNASKYLAAQAFHPNMYISMAAASTLYSTDKEFYRELMSRKGFDRKFEDGDRTDEIINTVRALHAWPSFKQISTESLFVLQGLLIKGADIDFEDNRRVSLIKGSGELFQEGLVVVIPDYSGIIEAIKEEERYLDFEIMQIDKAEFRVFLFDHPDFLQVCTGIFSRVPIHEILEK